MLLFRFISGNLTSLLWTLIVLLTPGNARQQPPSSSCEENAQCVCHGTVYYGKKFIRDMPGSGALTTLTELTESKYLTKEVGGPFLCSQRAFRSDPMPGYDKYCLCAPAELLDPPLCAPTPREGDNAAPSRFRVAVGFYGVSRHLRITLPTFKKHIFDVLRGHGGALFDVFASTALLAVTSSQTGEASLDTDDEYSLRMMRPCAFSLTPVETMLSPSQGLQVLSSPQVRPLTPEDSSSLSSEVLLRYTRRDLRAMILSYAAVHGVKYDAWVVLRPDAAVTRDLDLPALLSSGLFSPAHLYIPAVFDSKDHQSAFGAPSIVAKYLCGVGVGEVSGGILASVQDSGDDACVADAAPVPATPTTPATASVTAAATATAATTSSIAIPVKTSLMHITGIKRGRPVAPYDSPPPPPSAPLHRRLCSAEKLRRAGRKKPPPVARVAIGFYGMSRNLRLTLPSFEKHVFRVLDRHNIVYDVFWSTVTAPILVSNRSNEWNIEIDEYDVRLMRPCVTTLLPMYKVLQDTEFDFRHVSPHYHYKDGFSSVRNILCSLRTQKVLDASILAYSSTHDVKYDAVVTFRPDTAVVRDIDLAPILASGRFSPKHIYLPNFAHFKGVNDRSAYGSPEVMSLYLNREEAFKVSLATNTDKWVYNTETFLKSYLKEMRIPVLKSTVRVMRVRADGRIPVYDSHKDVMYMPVREMQQCQMTVTNTTSGESFTVLDTTTC